MVIDLNDPEMAEILNDFCQESKKICVELDTIIDDIDDEDCEQMKAGLERYGQTIDRVMGASKSLQLNQVGRLCELGKTISYKASQVSEEALLALVVSSMADCTQTLRKLILRVEVDRTEDIPNFNLKAFLERLVWLEGKFSNISRSSVAIKE